MLCGQEHNLDTTQPHIQSILFNTANQHKERNRLVTSTTPITFHTSNKPGGTLALTVESLSGQVIKQVRDKMGQMGLSGISRQKGMENCYHIGIPTGDEH